MTGALILGHLEPQKNFEPLFMVPLSENNSDCHQSWQKMTSSQLQPIQLTPLWEYVVRNRKFPSNIDIQMTFDEISERLNDPEWEVRQHALRVLIDVLPTLGGDVVDESMKSVIPKLINNLGNSAPAVRKGSLDALRVFLLHSQDRDKMIRNILQEGLNRPNALDNFQTNVTIGVLLSTPLLLFPSKGIDRPSNQILKEATQSLLSHLIQVTHQEAALKSLIKIQEFVGAKEFDSYFQGIDNKMKSDFDTLCDIYKIKLNVKNKQSEEDIRKNHLDSPNIRAIYNTPKGDNDQYSVKETYESGSDTSGIVEEDDETLSGIIPPSRVVLETEIKFNEETAITMTILEEKDQNSDESDDESDFDEEHRDYNFEHDLSMEEQRKTPRRVHFGGEVVKLRTPDSDDAVLSVKETQKTRIPLPISPATRMPKSDLKPKASSQPNSPIHKRFLKPHRSHSSSPRREVYVHNANLSPKKGILTRTNSPIFFSDPLDSSRGFRRKTSARKGRTDSIEMLAQKQLEKNFQLDEAKAFHVCPETEDGKIENDMFQETPSSPKNGSPKKKPVISNDSFIAEASRFTERNRSSRRRSIVSTDETIVLTSKNESIPIDKSESIDLDPDSKNSSPTRGSPNRRRSSSFEVFPRQERNYILMELSSPVKHNQKKDSPQSDNSPFGSIVDHNEFELKDEDETAMNTDEKEKSVSDIVEVKETSSLQENSTSTGELKLSESEAKKTVSSVNVENDVAIESKVIASDIESVSSERKLEVEKVTTKARDNLGTKSDLKIKERNWEDLGLVDQEVLRDLHNKNHQHFLCNS